MPIPSHSNTSSGFTSNATTIFKLGAIYAVIGGAIGFMGKMKAGQVAILSGSYAIASVTVNLSVNHCLDGSSKSAKILKAMSCYDKYDEAEHCTDQERATLFSKGQDYGTRS